MCAGCANDDGAEEDERRVADACIRRKALTWLDPSDQHTWLEARECILDLRVGADDGGNPVVGSPYQRAPCLQRAHTADLKMLVGGSRIAEPSVVCDIHQHRCIAQHCQLVGCIGILVADCDTELLARGNERWLILCACLEAAIGQLHPAKPFLDPIGYWEKL